MANETFYPPITTLVDLDDMPEVLGFVKDGLTTLLDNILYKDLQYTKSPSGDSAFYKLTIVSKKRLDFEIPGSGIFLVLNPLHTAGSSSEFPIMVQYNWPIIGYVASFNLDQFSFSPTDFFNLALKIFRLTEAELINRALAVFLDVPNPIHDFVDQVNAYYGTSIAYPVTASPIEEVLASIKSNSAIGEATVVVFALFLMDNLSIDNTKERLEQFFSGLVPGKFEDFILSLLKPKIAASLQIGAGIEFPRNVLLPVDNSGTALADPEKVMLIFSPASFNFSTETGIGYEQDLSITLNHAAQIGDTGIGITLTNAKLDISRTENIPEADQDGRPADFVGVYIEEASISLPAFWNEDPGTSTARIIGRNIIMGTGGFSGKLLLEATGIGGNAIVKANFGGGFAVSLDTFSITLHQNSITESSIKGTLKIPGLKDTVGNDAEISILVCIGTGGDFSVTLSENQGIQALEIPNILRINISSLSIGSDDGKFFVAVSGSMDFIANVPGLGDILPKKLDIKKLTVWQDGSLEFEGGGITLPKAITLNAGPVKFSITAIHFGSHKKQLNGVDRSYNYFGFDGGISINPGGVDARGDGIKFYYTCDGISPFDVFLTIDGIGISLTIPGNSKPEAAAVILKGYLAMKNADASKPGSKEYIGAISLSIPKASIAGSAGMRLNPDIPAFVVDVGIEVSVPILLGSTGLGIYGFRGLLGMKYLPSKTAANVNEEDTWWYYYKSKTPNPPGTEGINIGKFEQKDGFSLGAGVSLATSVDSGKTFSSKIFFLLGLPDVFLLQGQAAILSSRIGLDDTTDPPFSALIAISSQSVEAAFGVNYKLPATGDSAGDILTLQALLEMAFFYNNASGWYINLGREFPEEKRVHALILKLFDGYSFLMFSASGIKAGAGIKWDFNKSYGPVSVKLGAYLIMGGQISFVPVQIGGFIQVGGYAHLNVLGFQLGFDISAGLAAEAPKPFIISGFFKLNFKLKLFWFLTLSFKINLEFTWTFEPNVDKTPLPVIGEATILYQAATAINIMSNESFAINCISSTTSAIPAPNTISGGILSIPMDSFIDIEFLKPVNPQSHVSLSMIGGTSSQSAQYYTALVPPQKGKNEQVNHEFQIESIRIASWNGSTWQDYNVNEAVTAIKSIFDLPDVTIEDYTSAELTIADISELKQAYWQFQQPNRFDKLRVLAMNMFSYQTMNSPGGLTLDALGFGVEDIFCDEVINKICVNWQTELPGLTYPAGIFSMKNGFYFRPLNSPANIDTENSNPFGFTQGLGIMDDLEIHFSARTSYVSLKLTTRASRVIIHYSRYLFGLDEDSNLVIGNEIVETRILLPTDLVAPIVYDNTDEPLNKVIIDTGFSTYLNTSQLHIGAGTLKITHFYQGSMDEVKIFNGSLSQADVNTLFVNNGNPAGLVSWWELNGTPADSFGQNQGTIINTVVPDPGGVFNEACKFFNNGYIRVNHHESLPYGEESFSISAWILPNNDFAGEMVLVEKMAQSPIGYYGYSFKIDPSGLIFYDAFQNPKQYKGEFQILYKEWQHVVVTIDRASNTLRFYVNREMIRQYSLQHNVPGKDITFLLEACRVSLEDELAYQNDGHTDVTEEIADMTDGLTKRFQPIWRPNTTFAIQLKTRDKVTHSGIVTGDSKYHNFVFKTIGTLGHFHKTHPSYTELAAQGREDEYKLAQLKHYIDYETSFPDPGGKLLNAKPLYYEGPALNLFFRYAYMYSMYTDWDTYNGLAEVKSRLKVKVLDSSGAEVSREPLWNFSTLDGGLGQDITVLNTFIRNGRNCTSSQAITPFGLTMEFILPDLKPEKLYSAVYFAIYKSAPAAAEEENEVHKYVFQTSRYKDFTEHINSYLLGGASKKAVYIVEQSIDTADLNLAKSIILDTLGAASDLVKEHADAYDRIVNGALKIPALDAAISTEFNFIKDENTGNLIGIIIRSPEPLFDPKLPVSTLAQSIQIKDGNGVLLTNTIAKDPSKIFSSNDAMQLTTTDFEITFTFYLYDGSVYQVADQVTIDITIDTL